MIKIAICDDDNHEVKNIYNILNRALKKHDINFNVEFFYDGFPLLKDFQEGIFFDLLLLDIEMKKMGGIELAKKLKSIQQNVKILYISSHDQYIRDLFEVQPIGFIDKPIDESIFEKKISKICRDILRENSKHSDIFEFSFRKSIYRIPLNQIYYFESIGRNIYIKQAEKKQQFIGKINSIEKSVKNSNVSFLRVHQSFLINFDYIKKITFKNVVLLDGTEISIAEKRQPAIKQEIKRILEVRL